MKRLFATDRYSYTHMDENGVAWSHGTRMTMTEDEVMACGLDVAKTHEDAVKAQRRTGKRLYCVGCERWTLTDHKCKEGNR